MASAALAAALLAPGAARAQLTSSASGGVTSSGGTAGGYSESINAPIPNPERWLFQGGKYVDVTNTPRPQNLNPLGVNFLDCEQDLRLDFSLVISGFNISDQAHIEVWAGTVDCTQDANRNNINAGVSQPCWQVAGGVTTQYAVSPTALPAIQIYARDVLRFEQPLTSGENTHWDQSFHDGSNGESACFVQPSDAAVQISVYFLPVNATHNAIGTAYEWTMNSDLVAPPPPPTLSLNAGDSLLQANWQSPGNDPDIVGFALFSDPPAAGATTSGCNCGSSLGSGANSWVGDAFAPPGEAGGSTCGSDAETDAASTEGGATDASDATTAEAAFEPAPEVVADAESDAPSAPDSSARDAAPEASVFDGGARPDAGVDAGMDAGSSACGASSSASSEAGAEGGACYSAAFSQVYTTSGGGSTATTTVTQTEAGLEVGAEGGVTLSGGGISSIDPRYEVAEVDDFTATQMTMTGLSNGEGYTVVVASIDGSGNVGPVSTPACGTPQPTNDYFKTYKKDQGSATGCALETAEGAAQAPVFLVGMMGAAAALARRRRRR